MEVKVEVTVEAEAVGFGGPELGKRPGRGLEARPGGPGIGDEGPGVVRGQELLGDCGVQRVTRLRGLEPPEQGVSEKGQIADRVQDLVAHELVVEAQLAVQDAALPDHDRVLEASAQGQAVPAEAFDLVQEAEGAGGRDGLREGSRRDAQGGRLMPQERVVEADDVADLEVLGRHEAGPLAPARDLDRLQDLQVFAGQR